MPRPITLPLLAPIHQARSSSHPAHPHTPRGFWYLSIGMEIRPVTTADLDALAEIDGTVESVEYLHLDRSGEGLVRQWSIEQRLLRTKLIEANPLDDERRFLIRQIAIGAEEGIAVTVE